MYKKIVKRGGEEYTYYYHNCRIDGKVKNICLGNDLDEAKEKIKKIGVIQKTDSGHGAKLHHNKTLQKFWSQSGGLSVHLKNHRESAIRLQSLEKELKPKQIPKEVEGKKDVGGFVKLMIAVLVIAFSLGFLYFFNNSGLTGFAIHDDGVMMEINKDVSADAYLLLNFDDVDYKKNVDVFGSKNENGSYRVGTVDLKIDSFGINAGALKSGEHKWVASLVDGGNIVSIRSGVVTVDDEPAVENKTIETPVLPVNGNVTEDINITLPDTNVSINVTLPPMETPVIPIEPELPLVPPFEKPKSCTISSDCGQNYFIDAPYCLNERIAVIDRMVYYCPENLTCGSSRIQTVNQPCDINETCFSGLCGNWGNVSNVTMPGNITLPSNVTETPIADEILGEGVNILEKIVVGKPVRIMESVTANSTGDMIITIPEGADVSNVSRITIDKKTSDIFDDVILIDKIGSKERKIKDAKKEEDLMLTGSVVADQNRESPALKVLNSVLRFFSDFFSMGSAFTPTGMAVENITLVEENVKRVNHKFSDITTENTSLKIVDVKEGEIVEVYYELPGPEMNEKEIGIGFKNLTISSEFHYENVTAFYFMMDPREPNVQREFKLYHIVEGVRIPVDYAVYDPDFNGISEKIEWVVPHLSNETYELQINILNVQSYPMVGGDWNIGFNTTGVANLTISAVDGTTYDEVMNEDNQTTNDLGMVRLKCGDEEIFNRESGNYGEDVYFILGDNSVIKAKDVEGRSLNVSSLRIEDYSCNETGVWGVNVITSGKHYQRLDFGELSAYAQNSAYGWWNATFQKCMNITINNIGGTTLTDFPALINLSYDATDMNPDFSDIRLVNANCENYGSLLDYEMDNYTSGANGGNAYYWVRIPSFTSAGASISIYYKNSSAVVSAENKTGVWDEYYLTVYHFSAGGGSLPIGSMVNDSTRHGFNATVSSTTIVAGKNSGVIGGALWFDGGWSYMNITPKSWAPNRTGTIEMFINRSWANTDTSNYYIAGGGIDTNNFYEFHWYGSPTAQFWARTWIAGNDGTTTVANTRIPQFTYTSWATAWTNGSIASGGGGYTYSDGLFSNSDNQGNTWAGVPLYWNIGTGWYKPTSANGFRGTMDEVRYSNIARSNQWINQTVQMMKAPSSYVTFGTEQDSSRCNVDSDCDTGFECIAQFCFARNGRFVIQNSSGTNLTIIDKYGNIAIRGVWVYCSNDPPDGSFQIKNSTGDPIYWIYANNGTYCTKVTGVSTRSPDMPAFMNMNGEACGSGNGSTSIKHSLRIQNSTDNVTCFSDESGKGWLYTMGYWFTNVGNDM